MVYVPTAATLCTGEILSCLDTDAEFQHWPFQQWQFELRPTLFDTGQSGRLPSGTGGITIGKRSSRASLNTKLYICMYYLIFTT